MMLAVYVKVARNSSDRDSLHKNMNNKFPTDNLGDLTHYTGYYFKRDGTQNSITIRREACMDRLVESFNRSESCSLPSATHTDGSSREKSRLTKEPFREVVGVLM